jgi:hypothetical protein
MMEDQMGRVCGIHRKEMYVGSLLNTVKEKYQLEDLSADGRRMLKPIFVEYTGRA